MSVHIEEKRIVEQLSSRHADQVGGKSVQAYLDYRDTGSSFRVGLRTPKGTHFGLIHSMRSKGCSDGVRGRS